MARTAKQIFMVGDFETTVYKGQTATEVWASALVELYTEQVTILHSIQDTFKYFKELKKNVIVYYHNLKFDGTFWLDFLMKESGMKQAIIQHSDKIDDVEFIDANKMPDNSYRYSINDMGQWYSITLHFRKFTVEIRDSLKLLPFSVKDIGEAFKTKHRKLDMEYTGFRYAGCDISDEERAYIANDVLVVKEALEIMFKQGHKKLTIGSCCLAEYKTIVGKNAYSKSFPDMYKISIPEQYGSLTAGDYIRHSYKGGWCYLVKGKESKIFTKGVTCDVNSLYPSMMHSMSGNRYPIGEPKFWSGNFIPEEAQAINRYFFIRIKTRFYLKEGYLPFIQIKGSWLYKGTECLTTSDIRGSRWIKNKHGETIDTSVILTLTCTDYELFLEHYRVEDFQILDGCYFDTLSGIFDEYIDKYKRIKMESKGAMRTLAKLFLNNLYGKMAANTDSSFKLAFINDNMSISYLPVEEHNKKPGYIPVGSAITSYARNFTIRAAQANYHGADKPGFIYADTDSIHCDLTADEVRGIKVDDKEFCCWKIESYWDLGYFIRQKTYIEHVTHEDGVPCNPYYNVKCAGMPEKCKQLFLLSVAGYQYHDGDEYKYSEEELKFLTTDRVLTDFNVGLKVPGKLYPKRIPGGTLLEEGFYEMR